MIEMYSKFAPVSSPEGVNVFLYACGMYIEGHHIYRFDTRNRRTPVEERMRSMCTSPRAHAESVSHRSLRTLGERNSKSSESVEQSVA